MKQVYLVVNINMKKPRLIIIEIASTNSRKVDLATLDSTLPHIHTRWSVLTSVFTNYENFYTLDTKTSESKVETECVAIAYSMPNSEAVGEIYSFSYVARINGVGRMWQK